MTTAVYDESRTLRINFPAGGNNVAVSWPASAVPFTLQFLSSFAGTNLWLRVTNRPAIVGGRNTVTNDGADGIEVDPTSDDNTISFNTVSGHTYDLANEGGTANCFLSNVYTTSLGDITC